jgi:hypothetical protein
MPLSATELTWRTRSAVYRHGGAIARTAALAVLIATSGALARLSWLVVEQAASLPPPPGIMRTAARPAFPAPGRLVGPAAGYLGSESQAVWCWSPRDQATAPAGCSKSVPGGIAVLPELRPGTMITRPSAGQAAE